MIAWPMVDPRLREIATRAIELDPDLPDGHIVLGTSYELMDWSWDAAQAEYRRALQLDPVNTWALSASGLVALRLGHLQEGIALIERARELDPFNPTLTAGLATIYGQAGRLGEAEKAARMALGLDPGSFSVRWSLGCIRLQQGDAHGAAVEAGQMDFESGRLAMLSMGQFGAGHRAESIARSPSSPRGILSTAPDTSRSCTRTETSGTRRSAGWSGRTSSTTVRFSASR
jgi:cytochrome c-type biogenesis protein CcmH/NrfG